MSNNDSRTFSALVIGVILGFGLGISFSTVHHEAKNCPPVNDHIRQSHFDELKDALENKKMSCPQCPSCESPKCPDCSCQCQRDVAEPATSKPIEKETSKVSTQMFEYHGYRFDLKKWMKSQSLLPILEDDFPTLGGGGMDKAILMGEDPSIASGNFSSCQFLDVMFQHAKKGRCLYVVDQPHVWHNYDHPEHGEGRTASSSLSFKMNADGTRPLKFEVERSRWYNGIPIARDENLLPFMTNKLDAVKELESLIGKGVHGKFPNDKHDPILVMCANEGHMPLLFNFFCNLRNNGIKEPKHVVFTSSTGLQARLNGLGITTFYHKAIGEYPEGPSSKYGDAKFSKMMMLKQFSVYMTMMLGYDVLFQDVDVTWLKDPVPELQADAPYYHIQFMDDGSRRRINAPYFMNSGFFYLRNDFDAFKFWDQVTMSVFADAGNQRVVEDIMELHARRKGLRVKPLDSSKIVGGMYLVPNQGEAGRNKIFEQATVLHFCWTLNITVKYQKMVSHNSDFIPKNCFLDIKTCNLESGTKWHEDLCLKRDNGKHSV
eukprot:m.344316 g.344316  ORF g.344316 m.344316 type:complete len:545 (-) comp20645_c0_seq2:2984-4618(-)